jgi:hypothetical protein
MSGLRRLFHPPGAACGGSSGRAEMRLPQAAPVGWLIHSNIPLFTSSGPVEQNVRD